MAARAPPVKLNGWSPRLAPGAGPAYYQGMSGAEKPPEKAENGPENPEPRENPKAAKDASRPDSRNAPRPDPTRYGDWEKNGRCIDF
ncbi:MAG: DUF1674 domain-containing protein [Rhodospirillales bacterium]